jgi:5'-nucleotidase
MKQILITNDDGIKADGLIRLAEAVKKYGDVWVVAPHLQRSAASHSITLHVFIDVYEEDFPVKGVRAFAVNGTPGDCIRVGSLNIMPFRPDIVLSGINNGYNVGSDIQYSATVGAAMEAVFQDIPAVALSEGTCDNHTVTDMYLDMILEEVIDRKETGREILNINFPSCSADELRGIFRNRAVSEEGIFHDHYNCTDLPDGGKRYMVEGTAIEDAEEGSDLRALFDKYISVGIIKNIC